MSIKGFTVDGQDYQYNYPNLDNIPEITPESIGAASQEDFDGLSEEVDALKSESYNLIDPTGITPYQSTSAADLTRTGFVIRNTAEATYSRGYLYLTLKPNTDYTFSAKKHTTSGVAYVGYSEAPAEGEPFPSANISLISRTAPDDETITKTFTTTTGILVIRFYATWDTAELGKVEYSEIMVIEGTEAKPFVRHVFAQDDEARNAVNDPQTGLDQKAGILRNTASGAIVSFTPDASVKDLLGLTVAVEPVQDLHGYANPWPAGGGVNKFPAANSQNTIVNGVTVESDGNGVVSITGTATSDGTASFNLPSAYVFPDGQLNKLCLMNSQALSGVAITFANDSTVIDSWGFTSANRVANYTALTGRTINNYRINIVSGLTYNLTLSIMIVPNSADTTTFAPYSNICPISGWTGAEVTRTGKNLLDSADFVKGSISGSGVDTQAGNRLRSSFVPVKPSTGYWALCNSEVTIYELHEYDANKNWIGYSGVSASSGTFTTRSSAAYVKVLIRKTDNASIEVSELTEFIFAEGTAVGDYEPYAGDTYSITFPTEAGTAYGGTLDVTTGKLTVDMAMVDMGALTWTYSNNAGYFYATPTNVNPSASNSSTPNIVCEIYKTSTPNNVYSGSADNSVTCTSTSPSSLWARDSRYTDAATFKAAMSGVQLVYELATPQTYQLTPQQIETIKGQINNVWADAGDVTVEFAEDIKSYIDNKFAELQALALENNG